MNLLWMQDSVDATSITFIGMTLTSDIKFSLHFLLAQTGLVVECCHALLLFIIPSPSRTAVLLLLYGTTHTPLSSPIMGVRNVYIKELVSCV